jgi:MFS superfamily sulfate permease-like transporter
MRCGLACWELESLTLIPVVAVMVIAVMVIGVVMAVMVVVAMVIICRSRHRRERAEQQA